MGSYREIEGDLLDLFDKGEFDIIAHGANCRKIMGAGIAKQIKERYRNAYLADYFDHRTPNRKLGDFSCTEDFKIFNLYTQLNLGKEARYDALSLSLYKFSKTLSDNVKIGLPQIGCGIGGLEWDKVKQIIQEELKEFDVTIVIYNK